MTPKNKYSGVQRIVKEGLTIILVEADYILEEQELTELSQVRLKEIKNQTKRIAKAILEETPKKMGFLKKFLEVLKLLWRLPELSKEMKRVQKMRRARPFPKRKRK